ncbi:hypothetical protein [Methylorubrum extorquens]|uniref:Uncharacterized protein n=1 Tax=Methylorubrum extorquens (strain CM4 / NCIMB 13688) TaxID=440085 RepID=B7KSX0_METC4|nr:hypothetical protein [Methylorubrum extorquens]ACK82472.1 conserved hypothetical protein [Methylorubrum extorquens CM4]
MTDHHPDEQVTLLQRKPGDEVPTIRLTISLKEATDRVATAPAASFERLSSVILRNGVPIQDIAEIDRIHARFSQGKR